MRRQRCRRRRDSQNSSLKSSSSCATCSVLNSNQVSQQICSSCSSKGPFVPAFSSSLVAERMPLIAARWLRHPRLCLLNGGQWKDVLIGIVRYHVERLSVHNPQRRPILTLQKIRRKKHHNVFWHICKNIKYYRITLQMIDLHCLWRN